MDTTRRKLEGYRRPTKLGSIDEYYAKIIGRQVLHHSDTGMRKQFLNDIPVLITLDGTIVCIPRLPEMGLMSVVGKTGTGKTLTAGYLIDSIFWLWKDAIVDMNDSQEETLTWCEPNDVLEFKLRLKKINQKPMPLPVVYVFPNFDKYRYKEDLLKDRNFLVVSMPFEEIINNVENYLPNLGQSLKYIIEKKKELLEVESEQDLYDIIETIDLGPKGTQSVQSKLRASFKQLINEGILNITDSTAPSKIQVYDEIERKIIFEGNPLTAIMKAECVPSFITSDLYTGKYKDAVYAYWINSLFKESLNGTMKGKRVWIYFDELNKILDIRPENNCVATNKALDEVAARGRNNSISCLYTTQSYHNIPRVIRSQTKYAISFHQKDTDAIKELCEDFMLEKKWQNRIRSLKKYECVAATTEHFICYKGNKKWEESGPFHGMSFPALHRNKFLNKKI